MKKQLVIKRKMQQLPIDVREALQAMKKLNKNCFFSTQNCIILNPINIYGDKSFFTTQITQQSYNIVLRKQQWKIPQYATATVNSVHQLMLKRVPNVGVFSTQNSVVYKIPLTRLVDDCQSYYRMCFEKMSKVTPQKKSSNGYVQANGRKIKPVFIKPNSEVYVSTSPIIQCTVHKDVKKDQTTVAFFRYSIDTTTGKVTKAVQKAFKQPQKEAIVEPVYKLALEEALR